MMTRERDYSMMITKQPEWCQMGNYNPKGFVFRSKNKRACKVYDTLTGESKIYESGREVERELGLNWTYSSEAIKQKYLVKGRYRIERYEA